MTTNPWIGKLVRPIDSFGTPTLIEHGIVIDVLQKANGGFNCVIVHRDGMESSIPSGGLEEVLSEKRGKLQWQILESLGKKLSAAQQRYDAACALMGKAA